MPIQVLASSPTSGLISFRDLAQTLPSRRMGRPVAINTLHRWRTRGSSGVVLDAIRIGGSWYTSIEAFQDFCDRVTLARSAVLDIPQLAPASETDKIDAALRAFGYP